MDNELDEEFVEIDWEEEKEFIKNKTGLPMETVEAVLLADVKFLESKGIYETDIDEEQGLACIKCK